MAKKRTTTTAADVAPPKDGTGTVVDGYELSREKDAAISRLGGRIADASLAPLVKVGAKRGGH
jgi:hypothetical protein